VGPVLGTIFALAIVQPGGAFALLFLYSCGLAMPFLVVGAFTAQANDLIKRHGQALGIFNKLMGALLIIIGVLVITGKLSSLGSFGYAEKCLAGK
jgi:cytochrome c-type biogenesis protein